MFEENPEVFTDLTGVQQFFFWIGFSDTPLLMGYLLTNKVSEHTLHLGYRPKQSAFIWFWY